MLDFIRRMPFYVHVEITADPLLKDEELYVVAFPLEMCLHCVGFYFKLSFTLNLLTFAIRLYMLFLFKTFTVQKIFSLKNIGKGKVFNFNERFIARYYYFLEHDFFFLPDDYMFLHDLSKNKFYANYSKKNKGTYRKCILHLIEKWSNVFMIFTTYKKRIVLDHASGGQALDRRFLNGKRQKMGTRVLTKILSVRFKPIALQLKMRELHV